MINAAARELVRLRWDRVPAVDYPCQVCGVVFHAKQPAKWCSNRCRQAAKNRRRAERKAARHHLLMGKVASKKERPELLLEP